MDRKNILSTFFILVFFLILAIIANHKFSEYEVISNISIFIDSISKFSWQLLILAIFISIKEPIIQLIKRVKSIGYNGAKVELTKDLEEVNEKITLKMEDEKITSKTSKFNFSTSQDVIGKVVISWETLNKEIFDLISKLNKNLNINSEKYNSKKNNSYYVSEYLNQNQNNIYREYVILRNIRNQIVHQSNDIIKLNFDADEYAKVCNDIYLIVKNQIDNELKIIKNK